MLDDLHAVLSCPVAVVGLGTTGRSVLRWLKHRHVEAVYVVDDHWTPEKEQWLASEAVGQKLLWEEDVRCCDIKTVVISPGLFPNHPIRLWCKEAGIRVVNDIQLWAWAIQQRTEPCRTVGITGSNGKSTVTAWLAHSINEASPYSAVAVGNIGLPVLDVLRAVESGERSVVDVWVVELSSFQLDDCEPLSWTASTILNVSEDHLDYHGGMSAYSQAKARILMRSNYPLLPDASLSTSTDRQLFQQACVVSPIYFGREVLSAWQFQDSLLKSEDGAITYDSRELALLGEHNALNGLVVLALAEAINIDIHSPAIWKSLCEFEGLPHRVRCIASFKEVDFIDDSKGTNVGSTLAALEGLGRRYQSLFLIAGGDGKGQDFQPLKEPIQHFCREVVLIGRDAPRFAELLKDTAVPHQVFASLEAAVEYAFNHTVSGEAVVLSPACASLDMFRNYPHRAEVFKQAVQGCIQKAVESC